MAKTIESNNSAVVGNDGSVSIVANESDSSDGINDHELSSVDDAIERVGSNDKIVADPTSGIDISSRKPRRGSNRGTPGTGDKSGTAGKTTQKLDLKSAANKTFATQLVGLHAIAGVLTGQPLICAITDEQGEAMVTAITEVMAQYKIKPNPKVAAWAGLAGVLGMIYVPKVIAFRSVRAQTRSQLNVAPIRQPEHRPADDTGAADLQQPGAMRFG